MASALLFVPDPRRVLILGLGGGAMAHFFLHHFPDVSLTVIEREPQCVDIAHEFFSIPRRHRNLEIITGDARDVAPRLGGKFDLIMLDLFLSHGPPAWLGASDLFDACRARMARQGILSANFWAHPEDEELTCLRGVSAAFGGRLLLIPVSGYRNVVALGFTPGFELDDLPSLRKRARDLSSRVGFDVGKWLEVIGKTNRRDGTRLVI
ncbi:MAG: hypothetical protein R3174_15560, partial [Gammaproteobacteria bacterium]|nr:hypothetical protein [Gammaproteobacteria bacterium]